jgi:hypothetical protein
MKAMKQGEVWRFVRFIFLVLGGEKLIFRGDHFPTFGGNEVKYSILGGKLVILRSKIKFWTDFCIRLRNVFFCHFFRLFEKNCL